MSGMSEGHDGFMFTDLRINGVFCALLIWILDMIYAIDTVKETQFEKKTLSINVNKLYG